MNTAPMLEPIELIPVDQIIVEDRLRSVNPDHAALIAESFRANGQMTPIEVRRRHGESGFTLISGAHRLEAAKLAEMDQIAASIIDADKDQARLREIDENLCRRDLTELDRAAFLAERKVVWAKLNPEAVVFKNKKSRTNLSTIGTFAEEVAERLGLSRRSIDRAINRHNALVARARDILAHSRWADNGSVLDGLAKLSAQDQIKAAEALTREDNPARNLSAAIAEFAPRPKGAAAAEANQEYDRLITAWRKAGRVARKRFIDFLVAEGEIGGAT
ncbi:MAG: ParB N-terminal domain-containing protein [Roseomonas sp.]|nr:ParB N-terminal domain-containing protein [Roseomonas sp.]